VNLTSTGGGLWRCVNARDDIDGVYPPKWEKVQKGLSGGEGLTMLDGSVFPNTIYWQVAQTGINYWDQIVGFVDSMGAAVELMDPADKATEQGIVLSTTDLTLDMILKWTPVAGATSYQYQVADDAEFLSVMTSDFSTGQQKRVTEFIPGNTYYWRVRVAQATATGTTPDATPMGAPLMSPWSDARMFTVTETTAAVELSGGAAVMMPAIRAPIAGASGVSTAPTFAWEAVTGADSYTFQIAKDAAFKVPGWTTSKLAGTGYTAEHELDYSTSYFWKVTAFKGAAPHGEAATGVFTTMAKPVEAVTPEIVVPAPQVTIEAPATPAIPTYILWIIVVVGAVLIIAVIVLIVRTRRVV
jgi:hypothetical protein